MQPISGEMPRSVGIQADLSRIHMDEWLTGEVFRLRWWILICLLFLSAAEWYLLMDKSKARSVCLYTALGGILSLGILEYGEELILWDFPVDIIPIFPPLSSITLYIMPMAYSLVYQRFKAWKSYIPASLAVTAILSFAVEPLLSLGGYYKLVNWSYELNFPLFFLLAMATRFLALRIEHITGRARLSGRPS